MKRLLIFLWIILFMSSCATPPTPQNNLNPRIHVVSCAYPEGNAQFPAPDWVCNPTSVKGLSLAATSAADKETNNQRQRQKCEADGRRQLAQAIKTTVLAKFSQYVTETDHKLTSRVEAMTLQMANEKLSNAMVHKWASNPSSGTIYCLVGISSSQEQTITEKISGIVQKEFVDPLGSKVLGSDDTSQSNDNENEDMGQTAPAEFDDPLKSDEI